MLPITIETKITKAMIEKYLSVIKKQNLFIFIICCAFFSCFFIYGFWFWPSFLICCLFLIILLTLWRNYFTLKKYIKEVINLNNDIIQRLVFFDNYFLDQDLNEKFMYNDIIGLYEKKDCIIIKPKSNSFSNKENNKRPLFPVYFIYNKDVYNNNFLLSVLKVKGRK